MSHALDNVVTRSALPAEAAALTALLRRAKASWGYAQEWLDAWREELTIGADYIARERVVALEEHGELLGFFALELRRPTAHLEHLWIEPAHQRRGLGNWLLTLACRDAQTHGHQQLQLVSDPNAEAFYLQRGAIRIGTLESTVLGQLRVLPKLQLRLAPGQLATSS
jgi:ribosomal protein S18 acetylase RimI-like enzyme